jgi:hypothetical protein
MHDKIEPFCALTPDIKSLCEDDFPLNWPARADSPIFDWTLPWIEFL